jgi:hypothetical protein
VEFLPKRGVRRRGAALWKSHSAPSAAGFSATEFSSHEVSSDPICVAASTRTHSASRPPAAFIEILPPLRSGTPPHPGTE